MLLPVRWCPRGNNVCCYLCDGVLGETMYVVTCAMVSSGKQCMLLPVRWYPRGNNVCC